MTVLPLSAATAAPPIGEVRFRRAAPSGAVLAGLDATVAVVIAALVSSIAVAHAAAFAAAWPLALLALGEYHRAPGMPARLHRIVLAACVLPSVLVVAAELSGRAPHAGLVAGMCVLAATAGAVVRVVLAATARGTRLLGLRHRVVAIGSTRSVAAFRRRVAGAGARFEIVGTCVTDTSAGEDRPVSPTTLRRCAAQISALGADAVVLLPDAQTDPDAMRRLQWEMEDSRVHVFVSTGLLDVAAGRTSVDLADGVTVLQVSRPHFDGVARRVSDAAGRLVAAALLLLLLPVLVGLAIAIRVDSPGPALFRQVRVGRDGRLFTMWKLRTMRTDAEVALASLAEQDEGAGLLFKMRTDPRVTRLGARLRQLSLDELPQLVNVVRGEMALVGPRPALTSEVARYTDDTRRRLRVRPGITGLWQVSGRSDLSWEDTVRLDLKYVDNWSPALDLRILLRTAGAVLARRGAY